MMDLRTRISDEVKAAMKAHAAERVSTLRMVSSAIKDRDIAARGEGAESPVPEAQILALLGKMIKQRQESAKVYRTGGRPELADKEEAEIALIEEFLPKQLSAAEIETAITAAIAATDASSMKDMGRVMAVLKERHTGTMDFAVAGPILKAKLG